MLRNVIRVDTILALAVILIKFIITCAILGSSVFLYDVFNKIATFTPPGSTGAGTGCTMSTFVNPLDTTFVYLASYMSSSFYTNGFNLFMFALSFFGKVQSYRSFQSEIKVLSGKETICCDRVCWE